jgi:hypothetical protein
MPVYTVFSTSNVPPGHTSWVNVTPQFVVGTRVFTKPRRAFFLEGSLGHFSSASLGAQSRLQRHLAFYRRLQLFKIATQMNRSLVHGRPKIPC